MDMENEVPRLELVIADLKAASEQYENLKLSIEEDCKNEKSGEKRGRLYSFFFHVSFVKRTIDGFINELDLAERAKVGLTDTNASLSDKEISDYLLSSCNGLEKSSRIEPSDEISMAERYVASLLDSIHTKRFDDMLPF